MISVGVTGRRPGSRSCDVRYAELRRSRQRAGAAGDVRSFGREERVRMFAAMKPKRITPCENETFFPSGQICLVGIEPVSTFIVKETFVTHREAPRPGRTDLNPRHRRQ